MAMIAPLIGSSLMTYASGAATVLGGISSAISQSNAASYNTKVAKYNAQNQANAAQSNQNALEAKATQEEAVSQAAAAQKRNELQLKLSRAYAVAASQGGGAPQESLINGLINQGETAAGYELYSGTERAKSLRYQGEQGMTSALSQGALDVSNAKYRESQAKSSATMTLLGSAVKAGSMFSSFSPGPAPGAMKDEYYTDYKSLYN